MIPVTSLRNPDIDGYLLEEEGESLLIEVARHWLASLPGFASIAGGTVCFLLLIWIPGGFWPLLIAGLLFVGFGTVWLQREFMMRFCVTNMRVFNVSGIIRQVSYMLTFSEIVNLTSRTPIWGKIFHYTHLTFTSTQGDSLALRFLTEPSKLHAALDYAKHHQVSWPLQSAAESVTESLEATE